eukprot:1192418-Prorocentrum_minimum.AAC.1
MAAMASTSATRSSNLTPPLQRPCLFAPSSTSAEFPSAAAAGTIYSRSLSLLGASKSHFASNRYLSGTANLHFSAVVLET